MKKIILATVVMCSMVSANAVTWWNNGILYGNVCRNGLYYTVYPTYMGQPVGTLCPVRDVYGNIIGQGTVTNE